ncbi:MAG: hypothetical protein OEY20_14135, partial [Gemmatimonadota bacterium]|nr:hypothetical protein [Gemmatimonadota bacterium]
LFLEDSNPPAMGRHSLSFLAPSLWFGPKEVSLRLPSDGRISGKQPVIDLSIGPFEMAGH